MPAHYDIEVEISRVVREALAKVEEAARAEQHGEAFRDLDG